MCYISHFIRAPCSSFSLLFTFFFVHFSSLKWYDYQSSLARFQYTRGKALTAILWSMCAYWIFFCFLFFFLFLFLVFGVCCIGCDKTEIQHQFHWIHSVYTHSYLIDWFSTTTKTRKNLLFYCTTNIPFVSTRPIAQLKLQQQYVLEAWSTFTWNTHAHTYVLYWVCSIYYSVFPIDNCSIALVFKHIPEAFVCIQQQMNVYSILLYIQYERIHVLLFDSYLWIIYQWHTESVPSLLISIWLCKHVHLFYSLFLSFFYVVYVVYVLRCVFFSTILFFFFFRFVLFFSYTTIYYWQSTVWHTTTEY